MKLRIINDKRYSSGRWRVVNESGEAIEVPTEFNHPEHGKIRLMQPLCENTKEALIGRVLDLLVLQAQIIRGKNEQRKLAAPGSSEGTNSGS
jgi:hypothetical protein